MIITALIIAIFTGMGEAVKTAPPVEEQEVYVEEFYEDAEEAYKAESEPESYDMGIYEAEEETGQYEASEGMTYYGCLSLTAYEWTGSPCADGVYPEVGYTAACNNADLWHRWVYIEGVGTYYIHDTGGMGYNVIDIYLGDYQSCINFGSFSANVYVLD